MRAANEVRLCPSSVAPAAEQTEWRSLANEEKLCHNLTDLLLVVKGGFQLPYTKSLEIEQRLAKLLELVSRGEGSAEILASKLAVSPATVARGISALRSRGNDITAVRRGTRWCYTLHRK